ncbi:MAG: hypothetical protein ACTSW1_13645 [Candidatus Hodarchaeales archaeon]
MSKTLKTNIIKTNVKGEKGVITLHYSSAPLLQTITGLKYLVIRAFEKCDYKKKKAIQEGMLVIKTIPILHEHIPDRYLHSAFYNGEKIRDYERSELIKLKEFMINLVTVRVEE